MSRSDNVKPVFDGSAGSEPHDAHQFTDYAQIMKDAVRPSYGSTSDQHSNVFTEDLADIYRSCLSGKSSTCSDTAKPAPSADTATRTTCPGTPDHLEKHQNVSMPAKSELLSHSPLFQSEEQAESVSESGPAADSQETKLHTVLNLFGEIDANHDGFLSSTELKSETRNWGSRTRVEMEAVSAVERAQSVIEESSDDQWFSDEGITPADLITYDAKFLAVATAGKYFYEIDQDVDGTMTKAELCNFALKHPEESLAIDTLLRSYDESKQFGTDEELDNDKRGDFYIGLTHCRVPELFEEPDQMRSEGPSISRFVKDSYAQFNIMDEDGDGYISLEEANNSSEPRINHIFERDNAQLSNLYDDGEGTEEYGVSRMDLKALQSDTTKQALFDLFNAIDQDKNTYISKSELEKVLQLELRPSAQEFFSHVLDNFEEYSGAKGNGMISRAQLFTGKNYEAIIDLYKQITTEYKPRPC